MAKLLANYPKSKVLFRMILFWTVFSGLLFVIFSTLSISPLVLHSKVLQEIRTAITGTLIAFLVTWIFLKFEKQSFREIGLVWERDTLFRYIKGILLGAAIFAIIFLSLLQWSPLQLSRNTKAVDIWMLISCLSIFLFAFMEEIVFRSYSFVILNKTFGLWSSFFISAVAFALYHVVSGWSLYSAFMGPFIWAFVFGLAAVWSKGIAVPAGIHGGLNILQVITGMKGGKASFWKLSFKEGTSKELIARTENIGLLMQLLVLIVVLIVIWFFIRYKENIKQNNHLLV